VQHDRYFKSMILDYITQALAFLAPDEAGDLPPGVKTTPLRQEQPSGELPWPFRETDVPLLIEFPEKAREAFVVLVEEETDPAHFDILRLLEYCIGLARLARLAGTRRIVPVVLFLKPGAFQTRFTLGTERHDFLVFGFISCHLAELRAEDYVDSDNIVARLNLPNMAHDPKEHVRICMRAMEGLLELEPDPHKRRKYSRFIGAYARLTPGEKVELEESIARSSRRADMTNIVDDWLERGVAKGKAEAVLDILTERRIPVTEAQRATILASKDLEQISGWLRKAVTAGSPAEFLPERGLH